MKKIILLGVILSLFGTTMTACSTNESTPSNPNDTQNSDSKGDKKQLTLWMKKQHVDVQNKMIEERAKQFGAENNVEVNVEIIAYEDFFPKWTAAIESKRTPDISFFGYPEIGQFHSKDDVLMDVSDLYKRIEEKNGKIYDSLKNSITYDGKQFAIPFWSETQVLYYRKDMLKNAGFENPPNTWDEFRKIAKALTDPSKGIYGAGIGYGKGNSDAEWLTRTMIWSFGGSLVSKDGQSVVINSPESIETAKFISDIFLADKSTPPSAVNWDDSGNNKAYLSGQAAMVFNTGSILNAARNDNPELYKNTGIAPIPGGPKGTFIPGIVNTFGIFKNTQNKELAEKLIEYLATADWYKVWIEKGAPLGGPIYTAMENEPVWQDPNNKAFIDSTKSFTFLGFPAEYNPKAGEIFNLRYFNDTFQSILVSKSTPEKAFAELQSKVEDVYKK